MTDHTDIIGIARRLSDIHNKGINMTDAEAWEYQDLLGGKRGAFLAQALLIAVEALEKIAERSPHPNDWQPPNTDGWDNTGDAETAGYEQAEWHLSLKARNALSRLNAL